MKKVVALFLVSILLVTLMAPAFAGPVEKCLDCSGALISISTDYRIESVPKIGFVGIMPAIIYAIYEVKTTTVVCTNGSHTHVQRTFVRHDTKPASGTIA